MDPQQPHRGSFHGRKGPPISRDIRTFLVPQSHPSTCQDKETGRGHETEEERSTDRQETVYETGDRGMGGKRGTEDYGTNQTSGSGSQMTHYQL